MAPSKDKWENSRPGIMMKLSPLGEVLDAIARCDNDALQARLASSPKLLLTSAAKLLHMAAFKGNIVALDFLVRSGIDVNILDKQTHASALHEASGEGHVGACTWLLDHGADVNSGRAEGSPTPIITPVIEGREEVVRVLIERGADVNAAYGEPLKTALQFATERGHLRIAQLLREHGAVDLTGSPARPTSVTASDELVAHLSHLLGPVRNEAQIEVIPSGLPVAIHTIPAGPSRPYVTLFTTGISDVKMKVPLGTKFPSYAELIMRLPSDWPLGDAALTNEQTSWPFVWLRRLGNSIHQNRSFIPSWLIVSTAEPPEPIFSGTSLSCFLLTEAMDVQRIELHRERNIAFFDVRAVYQEERDLALDAGIEELLYRLEAEGIGTIFDGDRKNLGLLR